MVLFCEWLSQILRNFLCGNVDIERAGFTDNWVIIRVDFAGGSGVYSQKETLVDDSCDA